jgi:hypothetical protein
MLTYHFALRNNTAGRAEDLYGAGRRREALAFGKQVIRDLMPAFSRPSGNRLTRFRGETASKHRPPSPILAKWRNLKGNALKLAITLMAFVNTGRRTT